MLKQIVSVLVLALLTGMTACSRRAAPQPGEYRLAVKLPGGDVPMQVRIDEHKPGLQLWVLDGRRSEAAKGVSAGGHILHALLPQNLGTLDVTFDRNSLQGKLQRSTADGGEVVFPVNGALNRHYRFFEKSLTDNADVSGSWTLQVPSAKAPVFLLLTQHLDAVNGALHVDNFPCDIRGQVHDDDVYLAAFCRNQFWLLKGAVTDQGDLQGQLWRNNDSAVPWHAEHGETPVKALVGSRKAVPPWAVPAR